ncbi:MAG: hypothetical protein ACTIML_04710 [Lentilactobacillus parabuchneri]
MGSFPPELVKKWLMNVMKWTPKVNYRTLIIWLKSTVIPWIPSFMGSMEHPYEK